MSIVRPYSLTPWGSLPPGKLRALTTTDITTHAPKLAGDTGFDATVPILDIFARPQGLAFRNTKANNVPQFEEEYVILQVPKEKLWWLIKWGSQYQQVQGPGTNGGYRFDVAEIDGNMINPFGGLVTSPKSEELMWGYSLPFTGVNGQLVTDQLQPTGLDPTIAIPVNNNIAFDLVILTPTDVGPDVAEVRVAIWIWEVFLTTQTPPGVAQRPALPENEQWGS